MIQIILLVAVLISVWLGILQDYHIRRLVEDAYEIFVNDLRDKAVMYDDLAKYDSLEELQAAQNAAIDDGSLFDITL